MLKTSLLALLVLVLLVVPSVPYVQGTHVAGVEESGQAISLDSTADQTQGWTQTSIEDTLVADAGKQFVDVVVFTSDAGELGRALSSMPHQGVVGTASGGGFSTPRIQVPAWALERIKSLPSTIGVYDYESPERQIMDDAEIMSGEGVVPTNIDSVNNHKAPAAWARGYRGEGTEIAIVDDGIDFAHPDLLGTVARYNASEVPQATLNQKPWLGTYDGWPIAYDPTSMSGWFAKGGKAEGTWYANTTSTDDTVWHTIKVDGKNDFWTDGSEKIGSDSNSDIVEINGTETRQDYNLIDLWATQDQNNWYFAFSSKANHSTMNFGLYINTTSSPPWTAGATYDPVNGNLITPVSNHTPEFAIYMTHNGGQLPGHYDKNDTIDNATVWKWIGSAWGSPVNVTDSPINGQFGYGKYDFKKGVGFVEIMIPKSYLGNPPGVSVELFTTGTNVSHAQDTCYEDPNVNFANPDWSSTPTQLSAFVQVERSFWHHTRNKVGDRATLSWPIHYITTGTSKSGSYFFGDHPDKNLPQTRVLVVDEAAAGVYDTVYVDLDHNKDFHNDKALKKLGKYDASLNWHPVDWNGQGTIYDETSYMDFYDPGGAVRTVAYSSDGKWLVSGGEDHQVVLWDTSNWAIKWSTNPRDGRPVSSAFSPDSNSVAVGFDDASGGRYYVVIWDVATGTITHTLAGHTGSVNGLAWSQDGTKIASASSDGTGRIWVVATGSYIELAGHTNAVTGVAWRWSDNIVATSSLDGTIRLWDSSGTSTARLGYGPPLSAVDFNPTGTILAAASLDGNVTLWNTVTRLFSAAAAHGGNGVLSVKFNSTGTGLVTTSNVTLDFDATVVTWDVIAWDNFFPKASGASACYESARGFRSPAGAFAANGTQVASACGSSSIKLWDNDLWLQGTLRGHRIGVTDYTRWDAGDGLPDISGGMIYFIAQNHYYPATKSWGTPIPYSDAYKSRNGQENLFIPANGTLVAFMGEMDLGNKHGTLMASSIVGRGASRYYDSTTTIPYPMKEPTAPQVVGIAPAAKLVPIANVYTSSVFEGWWFTVQGYDGAPASGDEPQIAANGLSFSSTFEDGWDFYSRFADWITMVYASGSVAFTMSAGNDGNGYGTVTSPGSGAGVISVGASTDFFYRKASGLEGGSSQSYGDVVPFSSRGPTALGAPDPHMLANGRMSYGSTPLNLVIPYNGQIASELWSGTSLSSPLAAGILAMTEQAYKQKHGHWPDAATAKSLLMSSCDDINYDAYSQGAGFLNADRATKLAEESEGFYVTPSLWTPGNYSGQKYEAFTSLLDPGSSDSQTITIGNIHQTAARTANLSAEIFHRFSQVDLAVNTLADFTGAAIDNYVTLSVLSPAAQTLGGPGAYQLIPPTVMKKRASINVADWIRADLLRVTISANFTSLDGDGDGILGGSKDFTYNIDLYDWTWDGLNPIMPHTGNFADLNRMTINHPTANVVQATIRNPAMRTHDGLVVGIRRFPYGAKDIYFRISIEFFEKTTWSPFLTLDNNSVNVPPNSNATFTATVNVPSNIPIGSYEGSIYVKGNPQHDIKTWEVVRTNTKYAALNQFNIVSIAVWRGAVKLRPGIDYVAYNDTGVVEFKIVLGLGNIMKVDYWYDQVVTIPVSVTVPAHGVIFNWSAGQVPGQDEFYSNVISAGFGLGGQSGDWRFYPTLLPQGGLYDLSKTLRFIAKVSWDLNRTDIDVFSFGPGGSVVAVGSDLSTQRYGPFLVGRNNGGSTTTALVFTTTGGNMEIASPAFAGGLNIIAVHVVHMNGLRYRENVSGEVGLFGLNPKELTVVTNKLYGRRAFQIFSTMSWPGIGAVSAGPAPPERYMNEHIKQDSTEGTDFVSILSKGSYTRLVRVKPSALIFSANTSSDQGYTDKPCSDLDLGVFLDGKGPGNVPDGIAQPEEFVVYSAGQTATEEVRLIRPTVEDDPDTPNINEMEVGAPYLIKVLGYIVPWAPYGTFNVDVTLVQGVGFSVEGATKLRVDPYNISKVYLNWNLQGSTKPGRMLGALYIGPSNAPLMILVPITLVIDFTAPKITKFSVTATGDNRVDAATGRTTNDRMPSLVLEVRDDDRGELDPASVRTYMDGENVTAWTSVSFAFSPHPTSAVLGRWSGSIRYVPIRPLSPGPHLFKASVADVAGNFVDRDYVLVIDPDAPPISIEGPPVRYTNVSDAEIRGTTEPGATVVMGNATVVADQDGAFSFNVRLTPGINEYTARATDWFAAGTGGTQVSGNYADAAIRIVYDTVPPELQAAISPSLVTSGEAVMVWGQVSDSASTIELDPTTVRVTVNGNDIHVSADGKFTVWITLLLEGDNRITVAATDLAGNTASQEITVTRDTEPPILVLDDIPRVVTESTVTVSGRTSSGMRAKVNGFEAPVNPDGTFSKQVQLSYGMNYIVVRVTDDADNVNEMKVGVYYASSFAPESGAPGGYLNMSPGVWAAIAVVLGLVVGLVLSILFKPKGGTKGEPHEGEAGEAEAEEKPKEEEAPKKEAPPETEPTKPEEDKREAALRKALEDGKINKEVYEKNLARIKGKA